MPNPLPLSFYRRDTTTVARELIGKKLVHIVDGQRISGIIVETEAYLGIEDRACHSFGNRRTERTESMYLEGGHSYVYFIYGMHFCFNVVTREAKVPEAVLIRALEPSEGIEVMRTKRKRAKRDLDLTNGPGKLCQALGINRHHDRLRLDQPPLFIEDGLLVKADEIETSPRIGVDYAGICALWPLRFSWRAHHSISKKTRARQ